MQKKLSKTLLIFMMPKMTDFPRKVMFSLSLFVSFLIWKTAGSSSLVAVAGCDGRSDKKELQESIEWKYFYFYSHFLSHQLFLLDCCYFRTWPRPYYTPTGACWRMSLSQYPFLSTPYQTWSFPHISLFQGAQVRLRQRGREAERQSTLNIFWSRRRPAAFRTLNLFISEQSSNW